MNVYRNLYFATLVGVAAGLATGVLALLLTVPFATSGVSTLPDTLHLLLFGAVAATLLFLHFDRVLQKTMHGASVGWGLLIGLGAGAVAALLAVALRHAIAETSPTLYRFAVWTLCFSLIGLGIGLRWVKANRARVLHAYAGGLAGGMLGGAVFVLFSPHLPAGAQLAGLMVAGAGTGFGTGIAPVLVAEGMLRFISSGDARAQNKLGKNKTLWDLDAAESYVIGSAPTAQGGARFQQGADIFIPDTAVAPRHAVLFVNDGRYFIARHPDASGADGLAKYVLRIKGKTVVRSQELQPDDDVLIGRTALRFESRKHGA